VMTRKLAVLNDDFAVTLHTVIVHFTNVRGNGPLLRNVHS